MSPRDNRQTDKASRARRPVGNMIGLLGFIFIPSTLALLGFATSIDSDEQRANAAFPARVDGALGKRWWTEVEDWFEDRLPLRARVIDLERDISSRVDDSSEQTVLDSELVTAGVDDWLFLNEALEQPCYSPATARSWRSEIETATTILQESERGLVIALAPDRGLVVPDLLDDAANDCQIANQDVVRSLADLPAVLDLSSVVTDESHVMRHDSHWSPIGAMAAAQMIVEAVETEAWGAPNITQSVVDRRGDLERLVGGDRQEEVVVVTFPRLESSQIDDSALPLLIAQTPNAVDHNVFIAHDSYGGDHRAVGGVTGAADFIRPWFSTVSNLRLPGGSALVIAEDPVASALRDADTVVMVFVQRAIRPRFAPGALTAPIVVALADQLATDVLNVMDQPSGLTIEALGPGFVLLEGVTDATTLEIEATSGTIVSRTNIADRVVVHVTAGTQLQLDRSASRYRFVPLRES
jgi:hypothetical protein